MENEIIGIIIIAMLIAWNRITINKFRNHTHQSKEVGGGEKRNFIPPTSQNNSNRK